MMSALVNYEHYSYIFISVLRFVHKLEAKRKNSVSTSEISKDID